MSATVRVVVAEDDVLMREGIARLLAEGGFEVVAQAGDAEELLRKGLAHRPDVVIADVQMSVMGGLDLLATMRIRGYDVPFIFITAFPDEGVRTRALTAGAICFLAKPFAAPALIMCLDTALKGHRGGPGT